jgi:MerR family transcriptional regulator, light-induced transcriptional regulator
VHSMANELRHSIKVVARKTGLSPHLIRAWEKRYSTIQPERNEGNRRLYTTEDIERLLALKRATDIGHSIGDIAQLPTDRLNVLVAEDAALSTPAPAPDPEPTAQRPTTIGALKVVDLVGEAYSAVEAMDSARLEDILDRASVDLGQLRLLGEIISPLVAQIGDAWRVGALKVAHEHVASSCIRTFVTQMTRPVALHPRAPVMVATTPSGQLHELGAVLVAAAATHGGWRVVYAGISLPSEEIVSVALAQGARAVALSIVHPEDDPDLPTELRRLRRLLPAGIHILVGGRASAGYEAVLAEIGAIRVAGLPQLAEVLDQMRRGPAMTT